jgi:MATE family multidrug resistance protein
VDPSLVPYARDFLAARTLAAPASCVLSAMVQYRQGLGDARTPMRVGLWGNVLNAALAYALIHGSLGLPALGVRGAGYATALVETLNASLLLALLRRESMVGTRSGLGRLAAMKEVCALGVPTGLQFGVETLAFTAFTAVLGGMGSVQLAAHQVALSILRVSFLPGIAISEAASVLVGQALGRRKLHEADAVTAAALRVAVTFMCLCGVAFALAGERLGGLFSPDREVVAVVKRLLLAAAVFQLGDAVNIVLRGALRGARDVRAVMIIGVAVVWATLPGAAWLFGRHYGLGALGGWLGFIAETAVASMLLGWRWLRGAWREEYSPRREESAPNGILAPATP